MITTFPGRRSPVEASPPVNRNRHFIVAVISIATAALGAAAAVYYSRADLALAHHDARAHLVVARRILDSLMPGWQQIGAVWLPLPHVLNMLPVQIDVWYRSGASAIAISIASMAVGAAALASVIVRQTGSASGAAAAAALLMANPNVLYLQSTPMTEPLLFGTTLLAVAWTIDWVDRGGGRDVMKPGLAVAAACMTRYEAWPICAVLLALAALVLFYRGASTKEAAMAVARVAVYPGIAMALFVLNSRWTVGEWFVSSGFFVPENEALGRPALAWEQVREGLFRLSGRATIWIGYAGALVIAVSAVRSKPRASLLLVLSLAAAAALPLYAFSQGHPFRIRYSVPLIVASAAIGGTAVAVLPRRIRTLLAAAMVAATLWQSSPLDANAPLIAESQRDRANMAGRETVTAYLAAHHDGTPVMMSMGSLAHYMHDLSRHGFAIRDFLHEGNGEVWKSAVRFGPRPFVTWLAIEETAEGGDALFARARDDARFLQGFTRVAEGGGVALYRATSAVTLSRPGARRPRRTRRARRFTGGVTGPVPNSTRQTSCPSCSS